MIRGIFHLFGRIFHFTGMGEAKKSMVKRVGMFDVIRKNLDQKHNKYSQKLLEESIRNRKEGDTGMGFIAEKASKFIERGANPFTPVNKVQDLPEGVKEGEMSKGAIAFVIFIMIAVFVIIGLLIYLLLIDDDNPLKDKFNEIVYKGSGEQERQETKPTRRWEQDDSVYNRENIDNCGNTINDIFLDKNTGKYLAEVHKCILPGETDYLLDGDPNESNYMAYNYSNMSGQYRTPVLKVLEIVNGEERVVEDKKMKAYLVKKKIREDLAVQGIHAYETSQIYLTKQDFIKWRQDNPSVIDGETPPDDLNRWPSGPILHEMGSDIKSDIINHTLQQMFEEIEHEEKRNELLNMTLNDIIDKYRLDEEEDLTVEEIIEKRIIELELIVDDTYGHYPDGPAELVSELDKEAFNDPVNGDNFRIYLGIVFSDGEADLEKLEFTDPSFLVRNHCNLPDFALDNPDKCILGENGKYLNVDNPPINSKKGINGILDLGFKQFGSCPDREADTNVIFGLYRFMNRELSEQTLSKYDQILSSEIMSGSWGNYGKEITPETDLKYNNLCDEPRTISGVSYKETYCGSTIKDNNCVANYDGETKQCYEKYPKVIVKKIIENTHNIPKIIVSKIEHTDIPGKITELIVIDNGFNDSDPNNPEGNTETTTFLLYIMKTKDDYIDTMLSETEIEEEADDKNIIFINNITLRKNQTNEQLNQTITNEVMDVDDQVNKKYFFHHDLYYPEGNDQCGDCYIHLEDIKGNDCSIYTNKHDCDIHPDCSFIDGTCLDINCPSFDNIGDCMSNPGCRWKRNVTRNKDDATGEDLQPTEDGGQCINDLKLYKTGTTIKSGSTDLEIPSNNLPISETILALDDTVSADRDNFECFDMDGVWSSSSRDLCSGNQMSVYKSKIEEAFKLIHEDCIGNGVDNCVNTIQDCVFSDELNRDKQYNCPVSIGQCTGPNGGIADPVYGGADFICRTGECLVRNDESGWHDNDEGDKYRIMPLDARDCEKRTVDDCEKYSADGINPDGTSNGLGACRLVNDQCEINPNANDKYDCIYKGDYSTILDPSDNNYYVGDQDMSNVFKSLNCQRLKADNSSRGTFQCDTCDDNTNPCPDTWVCTEIEVNNQNTNYCVDTYLPNKNAFIINSEICFPPFYGERGSSIRQEDKESGTAGIDDSCSIDTTDRSQMCTVGTFCNEEGVCEEEKDIYCAAGPDAANIYKKNGSPMVPHLFTTLFDNNTELRETYIDAMNVLDSIENEEQREIMKKQYFDKENRSGILYELFEKYFNMRAVDYCDNIFTPETVLINPTLPSADITIDPSFFYPSWSELKDNILASENKDSIFSYLSSANTQSGLEIEEIDGKVYNWDNQICMMHRGVDNDDNPTSCRLDSWNKELCDYNNKYWDEEEEICREGPEPESPALGQAELNEALSLIHTSSECDSVGGSFVQLGVENNRFVPVMKNNDEICSICREETDDVSICSNVNCGDNISESVCNPDGTCNCYDSNGKYGMRCETTPATVTTLVGNDSNNYPSGNVRIIHPNNSYSYRGHTDPNNPLPMGYNMLCANHYLDDTKEEGLVNSENYTFYIGQTCGDSLNEICHSRKPIFISENYPYSLYFLNILDMDDFIEKLNSPTEDKYAYWPFYKEYETMGNIMLENDDKIMWGAEPYVKPQIESIVKNIGELNNSNCDVTLNANEQSIENMELEDRNKMDRCVNHPINMARIIHTIALFLYDPFISKKHFVKGTGSPDTANIHTGTEEEPMWTYIGVQTDAEGHLITVQLNQKLVETNHKFCSMKKENQIKYYALAVKMGSQFVPDSSKKDNGSYTHLQRLLYELATVFSVEGSADWTLNFYNAFFKLDARGPITSNNPGDKYTTITDCDCTRPSREDSVDRYTFIRDYLPDNTDKVNRWALKPHTGELGLEPESLYYYGSRCEKYDAMGKDWGTIDPGIGNDASPDTNLRCNINTSLDYSSSEHDYPRQINVLYSHRNRDGEVNIEDGSKDGDKSVNMRLFKNPFNYYNGNDLMHEGCIDTDKTSPTYGQPTELCGDRTSIEQEYRHQLETIETKFGVGSSGSRGTLEREGALDIEHLPDLNEMPEINLVERLAISQKGAVCDCSYSQSFDVSRQAQTTETISSKWGPYCQYTAQDVCDTDYMNQTTDTQANLFDYNSGITLDRYGNQPSLENWKFHSQSENTLYDDYYRGKRQKQVNQKGQYDGIQYSANYFDGGGNESMNLETIKTEDQAPTRNIGLKIGVDPNIDISNQPQDNWYNRKVNARVPVIKNPNYKNSRTASVDCATEEDEACNENNYSLCKCSGNTETRFTEGVSYGGDDKISCNQVNSNCIPQTCGHGAVTGGYQTGDPNWTCETNPHGFSKSAMENADFSTENLDQITDESICFCSTNNFQIENSGIPNCLGKCCPEGETCSYTTDSNTGKSCATDDNSIGNPVTVNGVAKDYGRKTSWNAHKIWQTYKDGGHYSYEPSDTNNPFYATKYGNDLWWDYVLEPDGGKYKYNNTETSTDPTDQTANYSNTVSTGPGGGWESGIETDISVICAGRWDPCPRMRLYDGPHGGYKEKDSTLYGNPSVHSDAGTNSDAWTCLLTQGKMGTGTGTSDGCLGDPNVIDEIPGHSNIEDDEDIDQLRGSWASYRCIPSGTELMGWTDSGLLDGDMNDLLDNNCTFGSGLNRNDCYYRPGGERSFVDSDKAWIFDSSEWNDAGSPEENFYNVSVYEDGSPGNPLGGNKAFGHSRNPFFTLAKACCTDKLKVSAAGSTFKINCV